MTTMVPGLRVPTLAALLTGIMLVAGCGSSDQVTKTTITPAASNRILYDDQNDTANPTLSIASTVRPSGSGAATESSGSDVRP